MTKPIYEVAQLRERFLIVNTLTFQVQSVWTDRLEAQQVAGTLNRIHAAQSKKK